MSAWSWPVQVAIYERLDSACTVPVYDNVPQDTPYPYITIGDDTSIEWDTDTETGAEATLTIHSWSRANSRSEVKQLQGEVYEALHRHELVVPGYSVVTCEQEFSESLPVEADGHTRHGVQRFRIILEKEVTDE